MNMDNLLTDVAQRLRNWLVQAAEKEASDLHVVANYPPVLRIHGKLHNLEPQPLNDSEVSEMLLAICPAYAVEQFQKERNADFALELPFAGGTRRYRANYFMTGRQMGACFRVIPSAIPEFNWSGFPQSLADIITSYQNGLVMICGVVGSGKTTTLAMLINMLNKQGGYRIVTIEEPVEYLFPQVPGSMITQREVGVDVFTFADGLKYALRQDPDVILVGEIRDRETAQMALSAAETGHLVFSTLHTRDAKGAITRFADLFPQGDQSEVRAQLSLSLRAVVSQHLLPNLTPTEKRVLALEVMFNTSAISAAIRFGKIESIDNVIVTGRNKGMVPLDESIRRLFKEGWISQETAEHYSTSSAALMQSRQQ
jgi:twitching motility protein PilT